MSGIKIGALIPDCKKSHCRRYLSLWTVACLWFYFFFHPCEIRDIRKLADTALSCILLSSCGRVVHPWKRTMQQREMQNVIVLYNHHHWTENNTAIAFHYRIQAHSRKGNQMRVLVWAECCCSSFCTAVDSLCSEINCFYDGCQWPRKVPSSS